MRRRRLLHIEDERLVSGLAMSMDLLVSSLLSDLGMVMAPWNVSAKVSQLMYYSMRWVLGRAAVHD